MPKERLDSLVVARGLAESREQAQRMIMAGEVRVREQVATKSGHRYASDVALTVKERQRFVSRGGLKLQGAFDTFGLDVNGADCLDVGASTGGFTDCLLQHGAAHVTAVDVGHGQLHWKLRQDARVAVIEQFNARFMTPADLPRVPRVAVTDVSFISLRLILPPMVDALAPGGELVSLIKPQFEAGRAQVGKGGVVRDPAVRRQVVEGIRSFGCETLGLEWLGGVDSPIHGPKGNVEFLAYWRKDAS